jgi:hypothetical protein
MGVFSNFDVCGSMSIPSLRGARYFVLFIDDYNGFELVFCIKSKAKILECKFQKSGGKKPIHNKKCYGEFQE